MKFIKKILLLSFFILFSIEPLFFSFNSIKYILVNTVDESNLKEIRDYTYLTPKHKIYLYSKINTDYSKEEIKKLIMKMNSKLESD